VFDHIIMDPVSILPIEASCMIESILLAEGLDFCCRAASGSSCYRNERSYRSCNSKNSSRLCLVLDITVQKAYSFFILSNEFSLRSEWTWINQSGLLSTTL
jgi:hypothetical protein